MGTPAGIGLEPTIGEWVENIVAVGREVHRVLRDDGSFWLNLGDAYDSGTSAKRKASLNVDVGGWQHAGQMGDERVNAMLGAKNLMGQPWRVAFALQDDGANVPALRAVERIIDEFHDAFEGEEIPPKALAILERLATEYAEAKGNSWILRSATVWQKLNPMPESARDRPTSAYEMIFLLTKQRKYFYDAEAVREPVTGGTRARRKDGSHALRHGHDPNDNHATWKDSYQPASANARNVWTFPTQGRPDAHFATFPNELPRRPILAGTSQHGVCAGCGAPWARVVEKDLVVNHKKTPLVTAANTGSAMARTGFLPEGRNHIETLGWQPTCGCKAEVVPATVLDPFVGSGTTLAVAQALGRRSVGLDLNPEYLEIARRYINRADGITLSLGL